MRWVMSNHIVWSVRSAARFVCQNQRLLCLPNFCSPAPDSLTASYTYLTRGLPVMKRCYDFFNTTCNQTSPSSFGLLHLDYCPAVWSGVTKKYPRKVAAGPEQRSMSGANVNKMHVSTSWFRVEERFTASLLVFVRSIDELKAPNCLFSQLTHSSKTHTVQKTD